MCALDLKKEITFELLKNIPCTASLVLATKLIDATFSESIMGNTLAFLFNEKIIQKILVKWYEIDKNIFLLISFSNN